MSVCSSIDVCAFLDAPALIDYVLNLTEQPNLHLIGFSKGTTTALILLSVKVEYNSKVRLLILLCPVTYIETPTAIIRFAMSAVKPMIRLVSPL